MTTPVVHGFVEVPRGASLPLLSQPIVNGTVCGELDSRIAYPREDDMYERGRFPDALCQVARRYKTDADFIVSEPFVVSTLATAQDDNDDNYDVNVLVTLATLGGSAPGRMCDSHGPRRTRPGGGKDKGYMIRDTRTTSQDVELRGTEVTKSNCGKKHVLAIGIHDFTKTSGEGWNQ